MGWIFHDLTERQMDLRRRLALIVAFAVFLVMSAPSVITEASEPEDTVIEISESEIPGSEIPESEIPGSEIPESEIPGSEIPESEIPESIILQETSDTESPNAIVNDKLTITFAKVGIGDCIIMECGGEAAAIDGGLSKFRRQTDRIMSSMGISNFKYLINTHPHIDHVGGLKYIVKNYDVGCVYVNGLLPENRHNKGLKRAVIKAGKEQKPLFKDDILKLGSATITVVGPVSYNPNKMNNNSLVVMVQHGEKRILMTGDALIQEQDEILESGTSISCDVLKSPHHAFKNASNEAFIRASEAGCVICSGPKWNKKLSPLSWPPFALYVNCGLKLYSTGHQGTLVMVSDGKNITWDQEPVAQP